MAQQHGHLWHRPHPSLDLVPEVSPASLTVQSQLAPVVTSPVQHRGDEV